MTVQRNDTSWRLPAEWERQAFVQLTWPHGDTDWQPILREITDTYVELALQIAARERLVVVARDPEAVRKALEGKASPEAMRNITLFECDNDDTWARDHAFMTLVGDGGFRLLDFRFNGWGDKFEAAKDNAINRRLYDAGLLRGEYVDCLDFVLEGGAIESDGKGTVFTTTNCLLAPNRNQPLDRQGIEERLKAFFSARRVVWIDHGNLVGDDTDGHIDTLVRVAPDDTLLYVGAGEPDDEQHDELLAMEADLKRLRTSDGRPYRLLKLPMPDPVVYEGERLPATYANFLVVNGAVLLPVYGQPAKDREAAAVVAAAFPGLEVVCVDCSWVVVQHGSLHCCTMQYPEGVLKSDC